MSPSPRLPWELIDQIIDASLSSHLDSAINAAKATSISSAYTQMSTFITAGATAEDSTLIQPYALDALRLALLGGRSPMTIKWKILQQAWFVDAEIQKMLFGPRGHRKVLPSASGDYASAGSLFPEGFEKLTVQQALIDLHKGMLALALSIDENDTAALMARYEETCEGMGVKSQ